jgi:hypothetical protein
MLWASSNAEEGSSSVAIAACSYVVITVNNTTEVCHCWWQLCTVCLEPRWCLAALPHACMCMYVWHVQAPNNAVGHCCSFHSCLPDLANKPLCLCNHAAALLSYKTTCLTDRNTVLLGP